MAQNKTIRDKEERSISFEDLKKKQSVRATFKLPLEIIELLTVVAGQLGIKQKSLLDQLVEDTSLLRSLAREADRHSLPDSTRRQKTYVISRNSLRSLNDVAKQKNISRDVLVEVSIKRLLPIIETELEKHNKRKVILSEMREHAKQGEKLYQRVTQKLGKDDMLSDMLKKQLSLAQKNLTEADAVVEKGMPMEDW